MWHIYTYKKQAKMMSNYEIRLFTKKKKFMRLDRRKNTALLFSIKYSFRGLNRTH